MSLFECSDQDPELECTNTIRAYIESLNESAPLRLSLCKTHCLHLAHRGVSLIVQLSIYYSANHHIDHQRRLQSDRKAEMTSTLRLQS